MKKTYRVAYSSWEMECCGNPFQIGDVIQWKVEPVYHQSNIEYYYDGHNLGKIQAHLLGVVKSIQLEYTTFRVEGNNKIPESSIYVPTHIADGEHLALEKREWMGYLVKIEGEIKQ